jgi:hypothetical protein
MIEKIECWKGKVRRDDDRLYTCARDPLTNACLSRLVRISNKVEN